MTEETKKLFNAPWRAYPLDDVGDAEGNQLCSAVDEITAKRIEHLPELYDKLMWAVVQKCPDAFLTLDECRLCVDKKCKYREIVELLRTVRDGK